jgi:hypothetical protein
LDIDALASKTTDDLVLDGRKVPRILSEDKFNAVQGYFLWGFQPIGTKVTGSFLAGILVALGDEASAELEERMVGFLIFPNFHKKGVDFRIARCEGDGFAEIS